MSWFLYVVWILFAAAVFLYISITWLRARYHEKRRKEYRQQILFYVFLLFCLLLSGSSLFVYERHSLKQIAMANNLIQSYKKDVESHHEQVIAVIDTIKKHKELVAHREKIRQRESKAVLLKAEGLANAMLSLQKDNTSILEKIALRAPASLACREQTCKDSTPATHGDNHTRNQSHNHNDYRLVQKTIDGMNPAAQSWNTREGWVEHTNSLFPPELTVRYHFTIPAFELGEPKSDCACRSPDCRLPTFTHPHDINDDIEYLKKYAVDNQLISLIIVGRHDLWPSYKITNAQLAQQRAHCAARKLDLDYYPVLYTYASSRFGYDAPPANRDKDREVEVYGVYKKKILPKTGGK